MILGDASRHRYRKCSNECLGSTIQRRCLLLVASSRSDLRLWTLPTMFSSEPLSPDGSTNSTVIRVPYLSSSALRTKLAFDDLRIHMLDLEPLLVLIFLLMNAHRGYRRGIVAKPRSGEHEPGWILEEGHRGRDPL